MHYGQEIKTLQLLPKVLSRSLLMVGRNLAVLIGLLWASVFGYCILYLDLDIGSLYSFYIVLLSFTSPESIASGYV